jgi:hypothetical protein
MTHVVMVGEYSGMSVVGFCDDETAKWIDEQSGAGVLYGERWWTVEAEEIKRENLRWIWTAHWNVREGDGGWECPSSSDVAMSRSLSAQPLDRRVQVDYAAIMGSAPHRWIAVHVRSEDRDLAVKVAAEHRARLLAEITGLT